MYVITTLPLGAWCEHIFSSLDINSVHFPSIQMWEQPLQVYCLNITCYTCNKVRKNTKQLDKSYEEKSL